MDYDSDNSIDCDYDDENINRIIKKAKLGEDGDGLNIDEEIDDLTKILTNNNIVKTPILGQSDCYLVEKLLDYRLNKKGKKEYKVQWDNTDFQPNWEPEENINPSLIRTFHINREVQMHNSSIYQPKGNAHIYLRVSDSSKTNALFKQSQMTQMTQTTQTTQTTKPQQEKQTTQTTQTTKPQQEKQTQQSYFGDFPAGNFSLDSQKETLIKYCVDNKLHISSIEMDDGISARNLSKLVGLQKIVENIQPTEVLLVLDLSRFARHTMGGLQILENLSKRNIRIYSVMDGMNYDTPASRHCVRTTISCAELESDIKSAKLKASIQNIKSMGGFIGSIAPFGFKVIRDGALRKLVKHINEQKILQIISDIMDEYNSCSYVNSVIADKLNNSGFNMRGKLFTSKNVQYIIKKYIKPTKEMNTGIRTTKRKSCETENNQNKKRKLNTKSDYNPSEQTNVQSKKRKM
jgi:DNA invertase Pin-like site-specific DNA recombinase